MPLGIKRANVRNCFGIMIMRLCDYLVIWLGVGMKKCRDVS